jgi:hypothetical protein
MKRAEIALPELALIAGTRGMLGAGVGLLLADHISKKPRKAVGWTLLLFGAFSTIPLAWLVLGRQCRSRVAEDSD